MQDLVTNNLQIILPVGMPLVFMFFDFLFKSAMGEDNFAPAGADMSLAGYSLFVGTLLAQVLNKRITEVTEVVTQVILALGFLFTWFLCLCLSYRRFPVVQSGIAQPVISFFLGGASLSWGWWCTWLMLR